LSGCARLSIEVAIRMPEVAVVHELQELNERLIERNPEIAIGLKIEIADIIFSDFGAAENPHHGAD
jgi:hypothetical protein